MNLFRIAAALVGASLMVSYASSQSITFNQADRQIQYPSVNIVQADLNHDGYTDFLFNLDASTNFYVLNSDGRGQYADWSIPTSWCPSVIVGVGDFLRHGNQSILVSYPSLAGGWYPSNGPVPCNGSPNEYGKFGNYSNDGHSIFNEYGAYTGQPDAGVVADFNGDGKLDLVDYGLSNNRLAIALHYGDGYGAFSAGYEIALPSAPPSSTYLPEWNLVAGDFDGNGCPDVAWVEQGGDNRFGFTSTLKVAYGDCKGGFSVKSQFTGPGLLDSLQVSDLKRRGISDLVATSTAVDSSSQPGIRIFYGATNQTFQSSVVADANAGNLLQVADLNGDGYPDLAYFGNGSGEGVIYVRNGDAGQTFPVSTVYPFGQNSPRQLLSGDYNHDGKMDLATLYSEPPSENQNNNEFSILYNTSTYAGGTCPTPLGPGIHICSPANLPAGAATVLASGNLNNPAVYMELWVDGVKKAGYGSTHELRATLALTAGTHVLTFYAIDNAGNKVNQSQTVTVQ